MPRQDPKTGARHTRHLIHQPAFLRVTGSAGDEQDVQAVTVVDFSFSGVRLATQVSIPDQTEVGLRLVCHGEAQSEVLLHTKWSRLLEGGGYHHGMQFAEEGALLPFLGLNQEVFAASLETGPEYQNRPGVLQVHETTRVGRIERLHCRVQGDLEIDLGLSHTDLIVEGQLNVSGGGVIGGQTTSSMRMDLSEVGDSNKTPTRLCLAFLSEEIADVQKRALLHLARNEAHVADCNVRIESFNGEDGVPSHDDREEVMALMFEMQAKEASVEQLKEKIALLSGLIARKTCGELSVRDMIHPGVRIGLHGKPECYESTQPVQGPVFIHADEHGVLLYATEDGQDRPLDQCASFSRCA